ncbi:hypothetical protein GCM10009837_29780 [Streptomyces durmitorensis]
MLGTPRLLESAVPASALAVAPLDSATAGLSPEASASPAPGEVGAAALPGVTRSAWVCALPPPSPPPEAAITSKRIGGEADRGGASDRERTRAFFRASRSADGNVTTSTSGSAVSSHS